MYFPYIDDELKDKIKEEGDYHEWIYTTHVGIEMMCYINRTELGTLCGYVVIDDKDNDLFGKHYTDTSFIKVHGGITYSDFDNDDNWVFGFDCAHIYDRIPAFDNDYFSKKIYRDMEYVISECESLSDQLSVFSKSKIRDIKINKILKNE